MTDDQTGDGACDARSVVLGRIKAALGDLPFEPPRDDAPRDYRASADATRAEVLDEFVHRVGEYKATVRRVTEAELPGAIAAACRSRGVRRLVVPADLPAEWAPADVIVLRDPGLTVVQLEGGDGVLTGCALGVAQTGTIVLDGGPGQGRRVLSLLPDYHLCVVMADQIVGLVPEAVARLRPPAAAPARPLTLISGPSATSDIELNRVEGVHGPRTLDVLVVDDAG